MVEEAAEVKSDKEFRKVFSHLAPRPISYAQMLERYLEMRFGIPEEAKIGNTSQLIYRDDGTTITFEVHDVGPTTRVIEGIEGKVKISFYSKDKKSIESITSEKAWENFDFNKSNYF